MQQKASNPNNKNIKAAKHLLQYICRAPNYGIELGADPNAGIEVYIDASYQDNPDRTSTEAFIILYKGALISWSSKKQRIIAPSTTIAKFCALDSAVKEAIFMRKLAYALGLKQDLEIPIPVWTDAANTTILVRNRGYKPITKWLDNHYFFIQSAAADNTIKLQKINGKINPTDGLTKPLDCVKFREFQKLIKLRKLDIQRV